MANKLTLQHKRSSVAGNAPTAATIAVGELAINFPDKQIYTKDGAGTIIPLISGGSSKWTDQTVGISRADRIKVGANAAPAAAYDINGTVCQNVQTSTGTCDISTGQYWTIDAQFPVTISLTGTIANSTTAVLFIKSGGSSTSTVTWDPKIKWEAGTPPTLTANYSDVPGYDVISLVTFDGGTNWYGQSFGEFTGTYLTTTQRGNVTHIATRTQGSSGTAINLSATGWQAGDFVIINYVSNNTAAMAAPAGFTKIDLNTVATPFHAVYYGFPTSVTAVDVMSSTDAAVTFSIFRNVNTTTPIAISPVKITAATGAPNAPAITTVNTNQMVVIMGV